MFCRLFQINVFFRTFLPFFSFGLCSFYVRFTYIHCMNSWSAFAIAPTFNCGVNKVPCALFSFKSNSNRKRAIEWTFVTFAWWAIILYVFGSKMQMTRNFDFHATAERCQNDIIINWSKSFPFVCCCAQRWLVDWLIELTVRWVKSGH